jgi:hypothetical protein
VTRRSASALASGAALFAASIAHGQGSSAASVEQVSPVGTLSTVRSGSGDRTTVAPIRGRSSSASGREGLLRTPAPAVAPELVEACRRSQAGDQSAPEGVDCMAALQETSRPVQVTTAEGSLLELFGQPGSVTTVATASSGPSIDANTVARDLSTGDVQSTGVAAVLARDRAATPPPSSPR